MKYYLKGDYYFDIDLRNQLRIAGPQNHLLLGLAFPQDQHIDIETSEIVDEQLHLQLTVNTKTLHLSLPLVTDMRTLRSYIEPVSPTPSYNQLVEQRIQEVLPEIVEKIKKEGREYILCKNVYTDEFGKAQEYGALIGVDSESKIMLDDKMIVIKGKRPVRLWIETMGSVKVGEVLDVSVFSPEAPLPEEIFSAPVRELYATAGLQVEYLIKTKKTSGFEYGTIMPRDWLESADLGKGDLSQEIVDYMYKESMEFVSDTGEGWHEHLVGQYKYRITDTLLHIDRKMIDIEPKYILGFRSLSPAFLVNDDIKKRLRLIARFVLINAQERDLITFKQLVHEPDKYHFIGNWRDSYHAFPRQKSPLGPYDVNCVLYPEALKIIRENAEYFDVKPEAVIPLIEKWNRQKDRFRLYHPNNVIGYSLGLHGKKQIPLPIAHTDEAYDLFYNSPSIEEVVSFARKLVSEDYFFTPAGPVLVANDEEDFNEKMYHGKVIWPKQTAFAVAGLVKQYLRGAVETWPTPVMDEIKQAALVTCAATFADAGGARAVLL